MKLDADESKANVPRKVRFKPKAPVKKEKIILPKAEKYEDDIDESKAEHLLRRFNETSSRVRAKPERKVEPTQVAFGSGGSTRTLKSYAKAKREASSGDGMDPQFVEKEYKEPFDYYSNYPAVLPLRRPYSGNPDVLNEEEFGDLNEVEFGETPVGSESIKDDVNAAEELGLLNEDAENDIFMLQLPSMLPTIAQSSENETSTSNNPPKNRSKLCKLDSLPEGLIGKLLVYKSGAVKLNLGGILYDVSPGVKCNFAQDVVAINTTKKQCCNIGEISKHAVVTPDIDSILANMAKL